MTAVLVHTTQTGLVNRTLQSAQETANNGCPLEVEQVVFTALAKDPARRFASVQAFAHAFEQACQFSLAQHLAEEQDIPDHFRSDNLNEIPVNVGQSKGMETSLESRTTDLPPSQRESQTTVGGSERADTIQEREPGIKIKFAADVRYSSQMEAQTIEQIQHILFPEEGYSIPTMFLNKPASLIAVDALLLLPDAIFLLDFKNWAGERLEVDGINGNARRLTHGYY